MEEVLILGKSVIRSWRLSDRQNLQVCANNRNISINLRDRFPWPYTLENADVFLASSVKEPLHLIGAVTVNDEIIGGISAEPFSDVRRYGCEVGYWLAEKYWGKGIMSEALAAYSNYVFSKTDFVRLEAHVFSWNTASCKILEKCGYTFEGSLKKACFKDEKWCDMLMYGKIR